MYTAETDQGFTYLLRKDDLAYWAGSNLPIIIILYRDDDSSFFWQAVGPASLSQDRRLTFDKDRDRLDESAKDRLADLTVPVVGFGHYIPPLGGGEEALVNILPVRPPDEMFVASTSISADAAIARLLRADEPARFDWTISGRTFWSFHDPRESVCRSIVDIDQVEAFETFRLSKHYEVQERNTFSFLLRKTLEHQFQDELRWNKDSRALYFAATDRNTPKVFCYTATKNKTAADVVNVAIDEVEERVNFVRHHAFVPRFELIGEQWVLIITPTYVFTHDGFRPLSNPAPLLSGKKRLDNSASLRGQVIMWHRFLTQADSLSENQGFFEGALDRDPRLRFDPPPIVELPTRVPEDVWGSKRQGRSAAAPPKNDQPGLFG